MWLTLLSALVVAQPTDEEGSDYVPPTTPEWPASYGHLCIPAPQEPVGKVILECEDSNISRVEFDSAKIDQKMVQGFLCVRIAEVNGNRGDVEDTHTLLIERVLTPKEVEKYDVSQHNPRRMRRDDEGKLYYDVGVRMIPVDEKALSEAKLLVQLYATSWTSTRTGSRVIKVEEIPKFRAKKEKDTERTIPMGDVPSAHDRDLVMNAYKEAMALDETCRAATTASPLEVEVATRTDGILVGTAEMESLRTATPVLVCSKSPAEAESTVLAIKGDDGNTQWLFAPGDTSFDFKDERVFEVKDRWRDNYTVCRLPIWRTSLANGFVRGSRQEWTAKGWETPTLDDTGFDPVSAGYSVHVLAQVGDWAVIRVATTGQVVPVLRGWLYLPGGPVRNSGLPRERRSEIEMLEFHTNDMCPTAVRGQWRSLASTAPARKLNTLETWATLPAKTELLVLCDDGKDATWAAPDKACAPLQVPGRSELVVVYYAGQELVVAKEALLTADSDDELFYFKRRMSPAEALIDRVKIDFPRTTFEIAVGGSAGSAYTGQFLLSGRVIHARSLDWGFSASLLFGFTKLGASLGAEGLARWNFVNMPQSNLEFYLGVGARLPVYLNDGGLGFDLLGRVEAHWLNDYVPLTAHLGLATGFGATFEGRGGFRAGVDFGLGVQLVRF